MVELYNMRSDLVAHIDTDKLRHNVAALRACCGNGVRLFAPIKADAYGHGVHVVAPVLMELGIELAAVATIREAVELRDLGWDNDILVLGNILAVSDQHERCERIEAIVQHDLAVTIADSICLQRLISADLAKTVIVHMKIDSGMGRMGVMPQNAVELTKAIVSAKRLQLAGVYSHFATADVELRGLAEKQLSTFKDIRQELRDIVPKECVFHLANSAATITMPEAHFDAVRPGLAMYEYVAANAWREKADLQPIMRLESHVSAEKELPESHCVGYGRTFVTKRRTRLGIIPLGYFDGFARALSNNATISTAGGVAPVIGRISMDQLAVDLTDLPECKLGTLVTLISDDPHSPQSVESLARSLDTIPYEITCRLGSRVDKIADRSGQRGKVRDI